MNFEHFLSLINQKWKFLNKKNKKKIKKFLLIQSELLIWKKNKLKLGKVIFEIKNLFVSDFLIYQTIEIVFINQDNTKTDELKLENRLEAIKWKWDFDNITAFLIVFLIFFNNFFNFIIYFYKIIFIYEISYFLKYNFLNILFKIIYLNFINLNLFFFKFNNFIYNILIETSLYFNLII